VHENTLFFPHLSPRLLRHTPPPSSAPQPAPRGLLHHNRYASFCSSLPLTANKGKRSAVLMPPVTVPASAGRGTVRHPCVAPALALRWPSSLPCSSTRAPCARCANTCPRGPPFSPRLRGRLLDQQSVRELLVEILRNNRMPFTIWMPWIIPSCIAHDSQLLRIVRAESVIYIPNNESC
jgi:hypothetical protein